jgi:hypothetical protein
MLSRLADTVPIITLYTDNGLVHVVDTHIVPENNTKNKDQQSGDIKLEDIICVFPYKKDVIRVQWRSKNDKMSLYHHDFMFVRDFKLDLKAMYQDKKIREKACAAICRKIIDQICSIHKRETNDGWFVLQKHESVDRKFPARTKHGKGMAYVTNLGISSEHESKGMMFWMGFQQLVSWDVYKSKSVRLIHEYVFRWKNTGKTELLETNFDFRIEDKTDPILICDAIRKCFSGSGVDAVRDREEILSIMDTWQSKDFLDYGTFSWYTANRTMLDQMYQNAYMGQFKKTSNNLSKSESDDKFDIAKKYQKYCLWYVREKLLPDLEPVVAIHKANQLANCKTYPDIEFQLMDLMFRCHALRIPIEKIFKVSESFKETIQQGNENIHKWSKIIDSQKFHEEKAAQIYKRYEGLGNPDECKKDKEYIFCKNQVEKYSLKEFAGESWIKYVQNAPRFNDYGQRLVDENDVGYNSDYPECYTDNMTWIRLYHPESKDVIFGDMLREMYDIWKQDRPLTDYTSDYGLSWMDHHIAHFPYDTAKIYYENSIAKAPITKSDLKGIKDKAVNNAKKLESFVAPAGILESDMLSADCFYHHEDKMWFTRNPEVIPLLSDVATVSANECESKYGFVGLGFSEEKVQMINDIPAVICTENVVASMKYAQKPVPILLKFITEDETTLELMDKWVKGIIHFARLSLEYTLTNSGRPISSSYKWVEIRTMQREDKLLLPLAERMRRNTFHRICMYDIKSKPEDFV